MNVLSPRACLLLLICLLSVNVAVARCPNTTCCACVSSPGCSWYSPPDAPAYCAESQFLYSAPLPEWAMGGGGDSLVPAYPSEVRILRDEPFHQGDNRMLSPQEVSVKLAVGVRFQLPVRLAARSARTRLVLRGPVRARNGHVEFNIRPASSDSCSRGMPELTRPGYTPPFGNRRRTGMAAAARGRHARSVRIAGLGYPRRRVYQCRGDGPGLVHDLSLELDVKRCLNRRFTLFVNARSAGSRSRVLKVKVKSMCECPTCTRSVTLQGVEGASENTSPPSLQTPPCSGYNNNGVVRCNGNNAVEILDPQAILCLRRGANEECVPDTAVGTSVGQTCSGNGLCVCGECFCRSRHELYPHQVYSGRYCECDDYSCERSADGSLCGGPSHGRCECGQCVCHPGWSGDACDMSDNVDSCVQPDVMAGTMCSGRGMCVGGTCDCPWPYTGQFCECGDQGC